MFDRVVIADDPGKQADSAGGTERQPYAAQDGSELAAQEPGEGALLVSHGARAARS